MAIQQYALLDPTLTTVLEIDSFDSSVYAAWVASGNPKATRFMIVNMIAQPTITATQYVTQNGWTVTAVDVEPVWVINTIPANQQAWTNALALNIVTAGNTAIANWSSSGTYSLAKDTVLLDLLKVVVAMLESQYGISN